MNLKMGKLFIQRIQIAEERRDGNDEGDARDLTRRSSVAVPPGSDRPSVASDSHVHTVAVQDQQSVEEDDCSRNPFGRVLHIASELACEAGILASASH